MNVGSYTKWKWERLVKQSENLDAKKLLRIHKMWNVGNAEVIIDNYWYLSSKIFKCKTCAPRRIWLKYSKAQPRSIWVKYTSAKPRQVGFTIYTPSLLEFLPEFEISEEFEDVCQIVKYWVVFGFQTWTQTRSIWIWEEYMVLNRTVFIQKFPFVAFFPT